MNIDEAKAIPMAEFLEKLNIKPYRDYPDTALYKSPLRIEKTASFRVDKIRNVWYDHGIGKGGGFFKFVIEYLKSQNIDHTPSDALRVINHTWGGNPPPSFVKRIQPAEAQDYKLTLKSLSELQHSALVNYLKERCIPLDTAMIYFKQAEVFNKNTGKTFKAIAFKNLSDGYELKNKVFKGCINGKDISFIRGHRETPKRVHVFEGMLDFVSVLALLNIKQLPDDVIVLNSLSCLTKAFPYITDYSYKEVYSWLDNDAAGEVHKDILKQFIQTQESLKHVPMYVNYKEHKDVNEWLMDRSKPKTLDVV